MIRARSGFTIIELLITMIIVGTLLTLGGLGMRQAQINARDEERRSDIATIKRGLERYYAQGNAQVKSVASGGYESKGTYPDINEVLHIFGWNWSSNPQGNKFLNPHVAGGYVGQAFPGVTTATVTPPGSSIEKLSTSWLTSHAALLANVNNGNYGYEPYNRNNQPCYASGTCTHYELYYKEESTGDIITVKSVNQ